MDITTKEYRVIYDAETATLSCKGSFLLSGSEEYEPILQLMTQALENAPGNLLIDIKELEFLNSSGINTLTKFVITARNKQAFQLTVRGLGSLPWQTRLVKNLQRLMPSLNIELQEV